MVAFLRPDESVPAHPRFSSGDRHLRLVVDNTAEDAVGGTDAGRADNLDWPQSHDYELAERASDLSLQGLQGVASTSADDELSLRSMLAILTGAGATVALLAAVVFGGLLAVRLAQGSPELVDSSPPSGQALVQERVIQPGDRVVVVEAGDSMWSLAGQIAPNVDRRQAVDALVEANRSTPMVPGQQIVVPQQLLD